MNNYTQIEGDTVKLEGVRYVIVDKETEGFRFWNKETEWSVELSFDDGESLIWWFDTEQEARNVKSMIDLRILTR